jgi:hypothetical protein
VVAAAARGGRAFISVQKNGKIQCATNKIHIGSHMYLQEKYVTVSANLAGRALRREKRHKN